MEPIRFAIAGTGYRATRYLRAALELPEFFTVTGVLSRTPERAQAYEAQYGVKTVTSLDALLETRPEFVLSCVHYAGMLEMNVKLLQEGVPTLSETPFSNTVEGLLQLYQVQKRTGTPLQLAEQYFLFPTHQARRALIDAGILGDVTSCSLFSLHNYHAVSIFRHYLGSDEGPVRISAIKTVTPAVNAGDRTGYLTHGQMLQESRIAAQFVYGDGRVGSYDFASTQYRSAIRSMHMRVWGTRGEWFDDEARYLLPDNRPALSALQVRCDRITGTIRAVDFEGERVYESPFRSDVHLIEDDIAMCDVLRRMGLFVRGGQPFYSLRNSFRDGYLSCLLEKAAAQDAPVTSEPMPWD
jgi:predicted dehydrogenase